MNFQRQKAKNRVLTLLHNQSLGAVEKAGTSLRHGKFCQAGPCLARHGLTIVDSGLFFHCVNQFGFSQAYEMPITKQILTHIECIKQLMIDLSV